jgi:hypothetical protein
MRYLDDLTPVQRYLALKAEMERLKEDLEELKPLLTAALMEEPDGTFEYGDFRFELGSRRTYAYSEAVAQMQRELHAMKKKEEQAGIAELKRHTTFPVVRAIAS